MHALLGVLLLLLSFQGAMANDGRILVQPFPPFAMHDEGGTSKGFAIDLFKEVHAKIPKDIFSQDFSFVNVTFSRMYVELQKGERRVSVALGKNPKRLNKFKWAGPYLTINMGVIARKDSNVVVETVEDLNKYRIASIANAAAEQALIRLGVVEERFERTPKPEQAFLKLASGRVDLMTHAVQSTSYMIKEFGYDHKDFEKVYNIKELDLYFAFSLDFSDEEISQFNITLQRYLLTPEFDALVAQYHLESLKKSRFLRSLSTPCFKDDAIGPLKDYEQLCGGAHSKSLSKKKLRQ